MVSTGSLELAVELRCSANVIWEACKDFASLFPKVSPMTYLSIKVLDESSNGKTTGSVICSEINPSTLVEGAPVMMVQKKRIENVDELNKTMTYSVIDGDILRYYKSFKAIFHVAPNNNNAEGHEAAAGCIVKWSVEFEKLNEMVPDPYLSKELASKTLVLLDAYLLSAGSDDIHQQIK